MDLGWRILWFDWLSLATGHDRVAAILPRTRRILGGSLETSARIRNACAAVAAAARTSEGLAYIAYIELTTDADNLASRRVIEAKGGTLVERFLKSKAYGGAESLRFRIVL